MKSPLDQTAEECRLAALHGFAVLDTPDEEAFDRLTALAGDLFDAPMALVSLIDEERQWFKSRRGVETRSTPRAWSFCAHAIQTGDSSVFVVEDASTDLRFATNPLVIGPPGIRFYAGAVLTTRDGHNLGALCVIDDKPRARPSEAALKQLKMLAAIVVDTLELRRLQRLTAEKAYLLDMVETMSGVGHWRYQLKGGRVDWSDEVYRIYGADRAAFTPTYSSAVDIFHPDDRAAVTAAVTTAIANKTSHEVQLRLIRTDGGTRNVVCRVVCELDHLGEVAAVFGVIQDITKQVTILRSVKRSERRYRLLADNMGDVVTRIELDGGSRYISPGVEQLLGYKPVEMSGRAAQDFVHVDDRPTVMAAFDEMAAGVERTTAQIRALRKDGSSVWVEASFRLVRDEDGKPKEMVTVIRDVSERKAMECALHTARAEAEAAVAVKAEFLANMSHELRTPLTAVLGFSRLIEEQPELTDVTRRYLDRVSNGGKALLSTVNDILDFSKLEAGQVEVRSRPMAVADLARATLDLFGAEADSKHVALDDVGLADLPAAVHADPDRVRQVLLNLIGNAVKFTDEGRVVLKADHDAKRQTLRFSVTDTGAGIPVEQAQRLFQRFSQVDGTSTRKYGGTGLGLAICKGLVEAMGGTIGVITAPGAGSSFWFEIPAPAVQAWAPEAGVEAAAAIPLGCRILVADDNSVNRDLVRAILGAFEADVTEVANGLEAVEAADRTPFDIILMDLRMPVLDGADAARRIREEDGLNGSTPILAFSADVNVALEPGVFDGRVGKPVTPGALAQAIAEALQPTDMAEERVYDVA